MVRILLLIGAAACFVIGGKMVAQDIVYDVKLNDPFSFLITFFPFLPLILMAPRYKNGKTIYSFIGAAEAIIIVMDHFTVLR